jgi:hypothetical protein
MYVSAAVASRLEYFATNVYHRQRNSWDCFSFAHFFLGLSGENFRFPVNVDYRGNLTTPLRTRHGRGYLITQQGKPMHAMIGFLRSNLTLGVLGVGNDLIIARCNDLMKVYGGDELYEITGVA